MTRILVTGSRDWTDKPLLRKTLQTAWTELGSNPHAIVVHGGARGADALAGEVARALELAVETHPADWKRFGKKAGPIRNSHMVSLGAELCLAFPLGQSPGTWGCIKLAEQAGIPVRIIRKSVA